MKDVPPHVATLSIFTDVKNPKLFMVLLGCKPEGRFTEQHDIFFGIADSLKELVPHFYTFWPEARRNLHIDAWREVSSVDGHTISVKPKESRTEVFLTSAHKLFFINLGGYKKTEFEEYHYKLITVAEDSGLAIKKAKQELFFKHTGFKGATAHIDDKYALDVDDVYTVNDILAPAFKANYRLEIMPEGKAPDPIHLGYLPLAKIGNGLQQLY